MDPDGREDYDSSMTENQFNKIANGFVVLEGEIKRTLNGKSWDEVHNFSNRIPMVLYTEIQMKGDTNFIQTKEKINLVSIICTP